MINHSSDPAPYHRCWHPFFAARIKLQSMRSRAHIKTHPLHPILVVFPIAFFTGTFVCDVVGFVGNRSDFIPTALYLNLAGIGFALLAAIPGLIDYIYTVPPASSGKKRATRHALLNLTVVSLFSVSLYLRGELPPFWTALVELPAMILLMIAGWMGGTLVHRNQIGVDIRYANAGKWKEKFFEKKSGRLKVAERGELEPNQMQLLHIGDKRIVLARVEDGYVAFDDKCTHRGGSLAGGALICNTVQCPWHGSQFETRTGKVVSGPAIKSIHAYRVSWDEDGVFPGTLAGSVHLIFRMFPGLENMLI